ncbi:MAG: C25 family cysteine peptidase [Caldilineaceae bacterium]
MMKNLQMRISHILHILLIGAIAASVWPTAAVAQQSTAAPHLQSSFTSDGLTLSWRVTDGVSAAALADAKAVEAALQSLPTEPYGVYELPLHLQTVLLSDDAPVGVQAADADAAAGLKMQTLASAPYSGQLARFIPQAPKVIDAEEEYAALPPQDKGLPASPLFILREGRARGQRVAVLAFSPLFSQNGVVQAAQQVDAFIPGARPLPPDQSLIAVRQAMVESTVAGADARRAPEPSNAAALQAAIKIAVSEPGMQQILGSALLQIGAPEQTELARLHLWFNGVEIPLEVHDGDGLLDAASDLRFFANHPAHSLTAGDPWNSHDFFWFTYEATPGRRMSERAVAPQNAPLRDHAVEKGIWEKNLLYETNMAGVDGDNWFAAKMKVDPSQLGNPASYPVLNVELKPLLPPAPLVAANSVLTITGSARSITTHQLYMGWGASSQTFEWYNEDFYTDFAHELTTLDRPLQMELILYPAAQPSDIRIDKVYWQQPATLDFNGHGAAFSGTTGVWRYQLANLPTTRTLYDVTDPLNPQRLALTGGQDAQFQDGPAARDYLLVGPEMLKTPTVTAHTPVTLTGIQGADAIYIAPAFLQAGLAPLVQHRQAQGYQVAVVDVQQIYDAWSYGYASPDAIRDFLSWAVAKWSPSPIAATLVGDGTFDPRNYMGFQSGAHNIDAMPAYLANVDPWLGVTACDNCYGQLDGAHPTDETADPGFLMDIWLGRLSVQDEVQLTDVVNKILRYETAEVKMPDDRWRQAALYIADNYFLFDGTVDEAGDFAYMSDLIIQGDRSRGIAAAQSPHVVTHRVYYDPRQPGLAGQPWREADAVRARQRVIEVMQMGPGLVSYNGHSNHFQWASTDRTLDEPYLFGMNDAYLLHNIDALSIVLEMTCLTGQFAKVSETGTTMDERLQRYHDGAAVAVWGAAGLGVAYGHDALLQGFHERLWSAPPLTARLGELVEAGYMELFGRGDCCQEARKDYLLFGDPLTPARVIAQPQMFVPIAVLEGGR